MKAKQIIPNPNENTKEISQVEPLDEQLIIKWFSIIRPKENGFIVFTTPEICRILKESIYKNYDLNSEPMIQNDLRGSFNNDVLWTIKVPVMELNEGWFEFFFVFKVCDLVLVDIDIDPMVNNHKDLKKFYKKETGFGFRNKKNITWNQSVELMQSILNAKRKQIPVPLSGTENIQ